MRSIELSPGAVRALDHLRRKIAAAVAEFMTATLPTDPYLRSEPLLFGLEGWRVARRGSYRVTFRVIDDCHVLLIDRIQQRAHGYRH